MVHNIQRYLSLLDCLEGSLICQKVSLPIFKNIVKFIFIHAIVLTTYLGNCAFMALIIVFSFL